MICFAPCRLLLDSLACLPTSNTAQLQRDFVQRDKPQHLRHPPISCDSRYSSSTNNDSLAAPVTLSLE